jgi:hypothetical protein
MPSYYSEQFEKAIPGSGGIISEIARRVGCDWHTADKWCRRDDILAQMMEDERESMLDAAEYALFKNIVEDRDVPSIKYYLSTKGKHRGYVQTSRIEGTYDVRKIDFNQLSQDQLAALATGTRPEIVFGAEDEE